MDAPVHRCHSYPSHHQSLLESIVRKGCTYVTDFHQSDSDNCSQSDAGRKQLRCTATVATFSGWTQNAGPEYGGPENGGQEIAGPSTCAENAGIMSV